MIKDKVHRQICIHPLEGEWQRLVTMLGSVFMLPVLDFSTFRSALVFGTKGVNGESVSTLQPMDVLW